MDSFTKTMLHLRIIGHLEIGDKLECGAEYWSISKKPKNLFWLFMSSIQRSFSSNSRSTLLMNLSFLFRDVLYFSENGTEEDKEVLLTALPLTNRGLANLQQTYVHDCTTTQAIEILLDKSNTMVSSLQECQ